MFPQISGKRQSIDMGGFSLTRGAMSTRAVNAPNTLKDIKSMHIASRKNELVRIEKDNIKIAKKIFLMEPAFRVNELRKEFE